MSGKLSRRILRAQRRAELRAERFGGRVQGHAPTPDAHYEDDCWLCRMAREQGLETFTTTLPNGMTYSTTVLPKGWRG